MTKTNRHTEAPDRELVERAVAGDSHAFSLLIERHYERALRVAIGLLKSRTDAEDVVQDAFVRVHTRLADFRAASGFYTWLYRIVVNLSIDRLRKLRRRCKVETEDENGREAVATTAAPQGTFDHHDPHVSVERRELRDRIHRALRELPEIHQAVIVLREVDGCSYEEIAQTLGIKKGTVMSRLFHARRSMQRGLMDTKQNDCNRLGDWGSFKEPALSMG